MIIDLNKQRVSADLVELFELEVTTGNYIYFTSYVTSVTFDGNSYIPLPIEFTGYESKSEGAYSRPRVSFANILTTFRDAIGSNDILIGKKLIRRRTLASQLDSDPPVELPRQVFIIDRIEVETALQVTFELAAPFDLAGVSLPGRYIIPSTCAWVYQGAAQDKVGEKLGGCTWKVANNNPGFSVYYDYKNYLFAPAASFITHSGSSYTVDLLYKVAQSGLTRFELDGSTTTQDSFRYWQAVSSGSGALTTSNARVCRSYTSYNPDEPTNTYYSFKEGRIFSDAVLHNNKIWVCTRTNRNQIPVEGSEYWERADVCGKKLSSCAVRFKAIPAAGGQPRVAQDERQILPYGGFPAARRYN